MMQIRVIGEGQDYEVLMDTIIGALMIAGFKVYNKEYPARNGQALSGTFYRAYINVEKGDGFGVYEDENGRKEIKFI